MNFMLQLRNTASRDLKSLTIAKYIVNPDIHRVLTLTYDKECMFGIKSVVIPNGCIGEPTPEMFTILNKILDRELIGNEAKLSVFNYAKKHGTLILHIVSKDLRCGISSKSINKAIKEFKLDVPLIPVFAIQLAVNKSWSSLDFSQPFKASIKYDGVRLLAFCSLKGVILKTRSGKTLNCPELSKNLLDMYTEHYKLKCDAVETKVVLDGELCTGLKDKRDRVYVTGRVNSGLSSNPIQFAGLNYRIFDYIKESEFKRLICTHNNQERYGSLIDLFKYCSVKTITCVSEVDINSLLQCQDYFHTATSEDFEGIVLKSPKGFYAYKRSLNWIKLKSSYSCVLKCVGIKEGNINSKYNGSIGSLELQGVIGDKNIHVYVGSGLSDIDRKGTFIGKYIKVQYHQIIKDAVGKDWTLFIPTFISIAGK